MFDFGIGGSEILVIAVVALIVIGPKDLPRVLRMVGRMVTSVRGMAREFQVHVDAAMKDAGLDELKQEVQNLRTIATDQTNSISGAITKQGEDMHRMLTESEPAPAVPVEPVEASPVTVAAAEPAPSVVTEAETPVVTPEPAATPFTPVAAPADKANAS